MEGEGDEERREELGKKAAGGSNMEGWREEENEGEYKSDKMRTSEPWREREKGEALSLAPSMAHWGREGGIQDLREIETDILLKGKVSTGQLDNCRDAT